MNLLREIERWVCDKADLWVIGLHDRGVPAEDGEVYCPGHWRETLWPCRDYSDALERIQSRRRHTKGSRPTVR